MLKNTIRFLIVLSSIGSAFLLTKKTFKKYLPVTLFSTATILFEMLYFTVHKKWKIKGGPGALICDALIFVTGPYFLATLLVFQYSKGKFLSYSFINIIADFIYAFPLIKILEKLKYFKLTITSSRFFALIISNAFLNYGFQMFYEKMITQQNHQSPS